MENLVNDGADDQSDAATEVLEDAHPGLDAIAADGMPEAERKPGGKSVTVTVDTQPHTVRKGRYVVSDFKATVGVDAAYQLDEVVNGEFIERKDAEKISIKGGEVFVSHVRGGAASA
jgi:hypothetical protein